MRVYIASSWKNGHLDAVINALEAEGHAVYDFRRHAGFHWSDVDPEYKTWTAEQYQRGLGHRLASEAFSADWQGLYCADACVLVLPCGRSAHLEVGAAIGMGRWTAIYQPPGTEVVPELMYSAATLYTTSLVDLLAFVGGVMAYPILWSRGWFEERARRLERAAEVDPQDPSGSQRR